MPVILALGRWGKEDQESKASLCYTEFKTSLSYVRSQLNKKGNHDKPQALSFCKLPSANHGFHHPSLGSMLC